MSSSNIYYRIPSGYWTWILVCKELAAYQAEKMSACAHHSRDMSWTLSHTRKEWEFRARGSLFQLSLPEGWPQSGWQVEQVGLTGKDGGKSSLAEGILYSS